MMTTTHFDVTRAVVRILRMAAVCIWICFSNAVPPVYSHSHPPVLDAPAGQAKRPVTVADAIAMTRLGDRLYFYRGSVAQFSPDGESFVICVRKGNLDQNTNEYSLLLWKTASVFQSPTPETLLTLSSSSNREAIREITWLDDNETLAFLGENPGESQQLYTFNIRTRVLKKLTQHQNSIMTYSMSRGTDEIAYLAQEPTGKIFDAQALRHGVVVSSQSLRDLIADQKGGETWSGEPQLLLFQSRTGRSQHVELAERTADGDIVPPLLSPDGKYLVVLTQVPVAEIPEEWNEYANQRLRQLISQSRSTGGQFSWLRRYALIDTATGRNRVLLNAPVGPWGAEAAWSSDSKSLVVAGTYLPLDNTDGTERKARQSTMFAIDVTVPSGAITKITQEDLKLVRWDWTSDCLVFAVGRERLESNPSRVWFCRDAPSWQKITATTSEVDRLGINVEEGMNDAPRIFAVDRRSHHRVLLLDLNPQFKNLRFGRVEAIEWKGSDGHEVKGGLYYPPTYVRGKRYPLVIQTHGFIQDKFWIDGPWTTAFAAQPLAGKEIMVLQVDESMADIDTPKEVDTEVSSFEGAIDYLDAKGLIDRNRVGLIGHSRTCLHVLYMLTHSTYHIAAASITDGLDAGYFQYLAFANSDVNAARVIEEINGAVPFGDGLTMWVKRSPAFSVSNVQAPLRIMAANDTALLCLWEWFVSLSRLGKPVEMIVAKDGSHILEKPWDRMISQQGNVDWFTFWLNGEEDPDPAKAEQYVRWRRLREQSRTATK